MFNVHTQRIAGAIVCAFGAFTCFLTWYTLQGEAIAGARSTPGKIQLALFAGGVVVMALGDKRQPLAAGQRVAATALGAVALVLGLFRIVNVQTSAPEILGHKLATTEPGLWLSAATGLILVVLVWILSSAKPR